MKSYLTLGLDADGKRTEDVALEVGFWLKDFDLELWLRLFALHVVDVDTNDSLASQIRQHLLFASMGVFPGCIPIDFGLIASQPDGKKRLRETLERLLKALRADTTPLDPGALNLLGFEGAIWEVPVERIVLIDICEAFGSLLEGKWLTDRSHGEPMPGMRVRR